MAPWAGELDRRRDGARLHIDVRYSERSLYDAVTPRPNRLPHAIRQSARILLRELVLDVMKDSPIWAHQRYEPRPVLSNGDRTSTGSAATVRSSTRLSHGLAQG